MERVHTSEGATTGDILCMDCRKAILTHTWERDIGRQVKGRCVAVVALSSACCEGVRMMVAVWAAREDRRSWERGESAGQWEGAELKKGELPGLALEMRQLAVGHSLPQPPPPCPALQGAGTCAAYRPSAGCHETAVLE